MPTTRPNRATRDAERDDATTPSGSDRPPTKDKERRAERNKLDDSVIEHEEEMLERGANQRGEGRVA